MVLKFYNTLTRKVEEFRPLKEGEAGLYTCGPTVYDFAHIGNFRTYMFEDLLRRWLKYRGYKVKQVMNLTDVDDKTIRGARKEGVSLSEFTQKYKHAFFEDIETLKIEEAEVYPAATEYIGEMVEIIKKLLDNEIAYKTESGDIYFSIRKFSDYGKLSNIELKGLESGKRVKQDEYDKDDAQDFALWKAWDEEDGDVYWETGLGKGRPGWHIECSAMGMANLGESFDIHTGGIDNMFPHHENEIAQSEGATGKKFVNYWLHSRHLLVEGKKMSKSLGNFYTLRDLKKYNPMAIRYVLLGTHYRQELNFTIKELEAAEKTVKRLDEFVQRVKDVASGSEEGNEAEGEYASIEAIEKLIASSKGEFEAALDDDLNIAPALAAVFDFVRDVNKLAGERKLSREAAQKVLNFMDNINSVLGFITFEHKKVELSDEETELVNAREEARAAKDWATADKIRDKLKNKGIVINDTDKGPVVKRIL